MITAVSTLPDVISAHDAEAAVNLSPVSSAAESFMLIPLSQLLWIESMLCAEECFGDQASEYAFG
jgi:hypothetical protein